MAKLVQPHSTSKQKRQLLFAAPFASLRLVESADVLEAGEVLVTVRAKRSTVVKAVMPLARPTDLAFELWRLKHHKGLTYGQILTQPIAGFLAPRSRSQSPEKVRHTLAVKFVGKVERFLKTPIGRAIQESESWGEWLTTGYDPVRLHLVPFPGHRADATWRDNYLDFKDHQARQKR